MDQPRSLPLADGDTLAYRIAPATAPGAAGAPLLLLHGLASNLTRWSEFVARTTLHQRHALLRIDLRGHGDSPTRQPLALERWSADLAALLAAERLAPPILVGHSLGAQVALHFAATHADQVRALVLIDPVFRAALHGKWRRVAAAAPLLRTAAAAVRGLNRLGLRRARLAPLDLEQMDRAARHALRTPAAEREFVRRYSSTRADLRHFRLAHYLQELVELFRPLPAPQSYRLPVLVLLSTGATFAALADSRAVAAGFARATIGTIDCHHWPLTEKPDEVRAAIERWVEAVDPPAGDAAAGDAAAGLRGDAR